MIIRALVPGEEAQVRALLADSALPVEDLDQSMVRFVVAVDEVGAQGAIGLEAFGSVGLLRSLVVRPQARGGGIASQLVDALEADARRLGIRQLVLLTQTAAPFFARRGYVQLARDATPVPVQGSAEFRSLCPASATCMTKHLEPESIHASGTTQA